jgi:polyphosphate kinase
VTDSALKAEIDVILGVLENDNNTAWDLQSDGRYVRRRPKDGKPARSAQQEFIRLAEASS